MRKPEKIRLKDGTVRYQVRGPKPDGGTQYVRFTTKHEAEAFAAEQHAARRAGATFNATMKFEELVKEFRTAHYVGLRPSATEDYDLAFKRAQRYLGGKLLRAIRATDIEKMRDAELLAIRGRNLAVAASALARAERRLVAARAAGADLTEHEAKIAQLRARVTTVQRGGNLSVNKMIGALRTALKFAQSRGYAAQNVASFVKKLKAQPMNEKPRDQAVLTPAELAALVAATDPDWRAAMGVLGYGGLRIGELLGLQWGDAELDRGRVLVRRQLCNVSHELRAPKTKAGTRFVELPPMVIKELRTWRLRCPKGELDLMFPNSKGGAADHYNFGSRVFHPALRRAGLRRVRIHDLRHGAASMMIAAGCDIAAVSRQLGHANVSITLGTYSHWFAQRTESGVAARLAAFLKAEEKDGCVLVVPTEVDSRNAA